MPSAFCAEACSVKLDRKMAGPQQPTAAAWQPSTPPEDQWRADWLRAVPELERLTGQASDRLCSRSAACRASERWEPIAGCARRRHPFQYCAPASWTPNAWTQRSAR